MHSMPSFRTVFKKMSESYFHNESAAMLQVHKVLPGIETRWDDWMTEHWSWIIEDMQGTFNGDTDTMKYVRPELYKKYKVKNNHEFDTKFGFEGRQGGWLVLTHFEGCYMSQQNWQGWMNEWTAMTKRKLAAYVEEVGLMVDLRHDEFAYQAGFQLYNQCCEAMGIG